MLPEDKVSGLAMQGKPVALSRGATPLKMGHATETLIIPAVDIAKTPGG